MGRWQKLGQVCEGLVVGDWAQGFAAVPNVLPIDDTSVEVIVSVRNADQASLPVSFTLNLEHRSISSLPSQPLLQLGARGCFDDSGVMPCWVMPWDDTWRMYYIGWNKGVTVPFRNAVGLAARRSNGTWHRVFDGPVLDRTKDEPHFVASCALLDEHCWYLACTGWDSSPDGPMHRYHIRHARTQDGIHFDRDGCVAIDFEPGEYAISRPSVLKDPSGGYTMWFSARGRHYQIFSATSPNGRNWARQPGPVLTPSANGWDSDMVCYPCVFELAGERYMLFNGNGYGKTGLGLALWEI